MIILPNKEQEAMFWEDLTLFHESINLLNHSIDKIIIYKLM